MLALLTPFFPIIEQALFSFIERPAIKTWLEGMFDAALSRVFQNIFLKQVNDPKYQTAFDALHAEYAAATTLEEKQNVMAKISALPHSFK